MRNKDLAADYIQRAGIRLRAVHVLHEAGAWADVVRESQEIVELALKSLLRSAGIDAPRIHDVSEILLQERDRFPASIGADLERLAKISRSLRRDRELAFYGTEDLTPSDFYLKGDAVEALEGATFVVERVTPLVVGPDARSGPSRPS
jgi:HEPN domain-containing protein